MTFFENEIDLSQSKIEHGGRSAAPHAKSEIDLQKLNERVD